MQRREVFQFFDLRDDVVVDSNGRSEMVSAMNYAMADGVELSGSRLKHSSLAKSDLPLRPDRDFRPRHQPHHLALVRVLITMSLKTTNWKLETFCQIPEG
jgi:hypothetical protein